MNDEQIEALRTKYGFDRIGIIEGEMFLPMKEVFEKLVQQWIPCSERMPENDDDVLCWYEYHRYGEYNRMYQTHGIGHYCNVTHRWGGEVAEGHRCKVLAWMPLPEPYQEEGEGHE